MSPRTPASETSSRLDRGAAIVASLLMLGLGLLPVSNWIPGGERDGAYAARWTEWFYGTLTCVGVGVVVAILRRGSTATRRFIDDLSVAFARGLHWLGTCRLFGVGLFMGALVGYAWIARSVFSARPLLIDELVQVLQARLFASGRLFASVDAHPEFFSMLHVVDTGEKFYGQFPPGGPAMLALGELLHATWLVGPLCGAVSVLLFRQFVRVADPGGTPAYYAGASLLFAVTPFAAFMFGSHMNHGPTLMWLLVALVALGMVVRAEQAPGRQNAAGVAAIAGFGFGMAATIRPLDAFAFALPAAAWLTVRALRDRAAMIEAAAALIGVAIPFGAMLWVNEQTTGSPLLFGYEVLWGKAHGLGFHAAPWGMAHTPQRGVELISLYLTRLNTYLFETPFPALLPAIATLAAARHFAAFDRYLLSSAVLLGALYFAYWHDGFFLGPRFVFAWTPLLVLLTARFPRCVVRPLSETATSVLSGAAVGALVLVVVTSLPSRMAQYRGGLTSMRVDYTAEARRASVSHALVFVRESWGAQLIARMWGIGVSRSAAAALYEKVDACDLDRRLRVVEDARSLGADAERALEPLLADSSSVRPSPLSPDSTEKVRPGAVYDATCLRRIAEDREGYALLAPIFLERSSENVYARDLHARDSLLVKRYPGRPLYLLRRDGAEAGAPLHWIPLRRDSVMAAWRTPAP